MTSQSEQLLKEEIRKIVYNAVVNEQFQYNDFELIVNNLFSVLLSKVREAHADGVREGKAYVGKVKREAYQKGFIEGQNKSKPTCILDCKFCKKG